jgi:putative component of toxin-antitoxin plasmid stabilization module
MEMFKGIVRELKDPDKIIERIERIQKGEFGP